MENVVDLTLAAEARRSLHRVLDQRGDFSLEVIVQDGGSRDGTRELLEGMRDRIDEIGVPTRYFEEASSVGFRRSVVYGLSTLRVVGRYLLHRTRLRRAAQLTRRAGG